MASGVRRSRRVLDIWPGFVDALASLLIIILFLLLVFTLAQFFLAQALSGRDVALERLNRQLSELSDMLALEQRAASDLRSTVGQLSLELQQSLIARDRLSAGLTEATDRAEKVARDLTASRDRANELEARLSTAAERTALAQKEIDVRDIRLRELLERAERGEAALSQEQTVHGASRAAVETLNAQVAALRQQLARLAAVLDASEVKAKDQQVQIVDLGRRLNLALASKVEELARYRSEFFGRLREVLGDRQDVRIVGDRFVFQSEVLFASGSAVLEPAGREQIRGLGQTLKEISAKIPTELNWILRVDGHTDRRPITSANFPSNWELSTSRAISVVKYLVEIGIPAERLAATGFGEFQQLDQRNDEIGFRRNRRIELKLTDR